MRERKTNFNAFISGRTKTSSTLGRRFARSPAPWSPRFSCNSVNGGRKHELRDVPGEGFRLSRPWAAPLRPLGLCPESFVPSAASSSSSLFPKRGVFSVPFAACPAGALAKAGAKRAAIFFQLLQCKNPRGRPARPMGSYIAEDAPALLPLPSRAPGRARAARLGNRPGDDGRGSRTTQCPARHGGRFIVPKTLVRYARGSKVFGKFGSPEEGAIALIGRSRFDLEAPRCSSHPAYTDRLGNRALPLW
jgi:hypothetical protein